MTRPSRGNRDDGERDGCRERIARFVLGQPFARRLALTHAIDDFADSMINLALVGSLFFSVSLDASRSRIMLYLVLAAAPLAVAAPIVGTALDRTRAGYRYAIAGSQVARAAVSVALAGSLLSVALYPLAFMMLLCRKVYGLAQGSLLSQMTDDSQELLQADSHITRTGTAVGGLGTVVGGVLLSLDQAAALPVIAIPVFLLAALVSSGLPRPVHAVHVASVPRLSEIIPREIWSPTAAVAAIRVAAGALTYLLAFAIKRGGGDEWIYAASLIAAGVGGLLATLVTARLHRWLEPNGVLLLSLAVPGVVSAVGVLTIGNAGVLVIAFAIGLGSGVASRSITVLHASVAVLARGRTIARSQLLFQVAGLLGACLAVQLAPAPRPGFAATSLVLIASAAAYASRSRVSLRVQASRMLLGDQAPSHHTSLPQSLLIEAERLAGLGAYRMAIVVADSAVRVLLQRRAPTDRHPRLDEWTVLGARIADAAREDSHPASDLVEEVLAVANALIGDDPTTPETHWYSSRSLV